MTPPWLSLALAATVAGCALSHAAPPSEPPGPELDVAALRAEGPAALARLLARFDRMAPGPARDALAADIDRVAGQRYATTSRLFWYTDESAAKREAVRTNRPVLQLQMLGRLDEELSCANSRLFRTTLYANAEVARFLRENFVLYWQSERPVPRVTIDFGDGRRIETTTTGNSAHYVLDHRGKVVDVIPGVYAPAAFRAELEKSLALFASLRPLDELQRDEAVAQHHREAAARLEREWQALAGTPYLPDARFLLTQSDIDSALARAQLATTSKAFIEVPLLAELSLGVSPGDISEADAAQWAAIGQRTWRIGKPVTLSSERPLFFPSGRSSPAPHGTPPRVLDDQSRALVLSLYARGPATTPEERARMLARLEQHLVADSALNQFTLRRQIHEHLAEHERRFLLVNRFVYEDLFHTPSTDPWLGLLPRTHFTGLPGDGAVVP